MKQHSPNYSDPKYSHHRTYLGQTNTVIQVIIPDQLFDDTECICYHT